MLVLARKPSEEVVITIPEGTEIPKGGLKIKVKVVRVGSLSNVRLGIIAPDDIPVHRSEVQDEIDARSTNHGKAVTA